MNLLLDIITAPAVPEKSHALYHALVCILGSVVILIIVLAIRIFVDAISREEHLRHEEREWNREKSDRKEDTEHKGRKS